MLLAFSVIFTAVCFTAMVGFAIVLAFDRCDEGD